MNKKLLASIILLVALTSGCLGAGPVTTPQTPAGLAATATQAPLSTSTPTPGSTDEPLVHQPELISKGKLDCSLDGAFIKCIDDVLNIEFEYPAVWGEIEAVLRTGGYAGFAYDYYFGGKTIAEAEPLVAGGRSVDFSEGRGGMSTDFAGYGEGGLQLKQSCDVSWQNMYPVCQSVQPDVAWMIRFPDASYICDSAPGFYTTPVFRIEVNLPDNPIIHGFVFEAPLLSEQFSTEVKKELYPLLGMGADSIATKCGNEDRRAFDAKRQVFLDRLTDRSADRETLQNLDELTRLVESIFFR